MDRLDRLNSAKSRHPFGCPLLPILRFMDPRARSFCWLSLVPSEPFTASMIKFTIRSSAQVHSIGKRVAENYQRGLSVIKNLFGIILFSITANGNAESLSFPSFLIEIPDGWEQSIENGPNENSVGVIGLRDRNGAGILRMRSYDAPGAVSEDRLRNLTNLDLSTPLAWEHWGDYAGYQHSYTENGVFYRQWWIANERTILFITYQCDPKSRDIETAVIDKIVHSITVNNTQTR